MKKIIPLLLLASLISLSSCGPNNVNNDSLGGSNTSYSSDTKNSVVIESTDIIYTDKNDTLEFDDFSVKVGIDRNSTYLRLCAYIKNKNTVAQQFIISNVELIKENTQATYTVKYDEELSLNAELSKYIYFESEIPSSIDDDSYKFSFVINNKKIIFNLYERPDSIREDRKVSFMVYGKVVNEVIVKDGGKIGDNYNFIYEAEDHQRYFEDWYFDSSFNDKVYSETTINEDTILYGRATCLFRTNGLINWKIKETVYSLISLYYIPSDGIICVPSNCLVGNKYYKTALEKGSFELYDKYRYENLPSIKEIYIPKDIFEISRYSFDGLKNVKIYFEGTEDEWMTKFTCAKSVIPTDNIIFNTKAPF